MDEDDPVARIDPRTYYDELGADEWERLERTFKATFEFENTVDYLKEYLPDSGRILDVGGAAGRYSIWLAERGYDVTLVDISDEQLAVAREKRAERDLDGRIDVRHGDVRDLAFGDDAFDATLCLGGPLSHVIDAEERARAVRELHRVTASDAPVFVSVMGFVAVVQNLIKCAGSFPQGVRQLPGLVETGTYSRELIEAYEIDDPSFVECHFFRADELEAVLSENGLAVERLVGLEGPASNFDGEVEEAEAENRARIADAVRTLREDRTIADLSNHILAVSRVE